MPIRTSMQVLVARLRSSTGAATNDTFQGVTYWSDEQLQDELDRFQFVVNSATLTVKQQLADGVYDYRRYEFTLPRGFWLEDLYVVRDNGGAAVGEDFTATYNEQSGFGSVVFDASYGNRTLTVDVVAYDWHMAAASVWGQKASHRYDFIKIKAADHQFDGAAEYAHCVQREAWHRSKRVKMFPKGSRGYVGATAERRFRG